MFIFVPNDSVLSENMHFIQYCQMMTFTISGTCHHQIIWPELAYSTSFFLLRWKNRLRHLSLGVLYRMRAPYFVVCPSYFYYIENRSDGYMSHQKDIYNHETNLTRVNSFNNICFKFRIDKSTQTRQFRGNTANACTLPGGSPLALLFFLKICRFVLNVESEVHISTYGYFFAPKWKKALKLPVEQNLDG